MSVKIDTLRFTKRQVDEAGKILISTNASYEEKDNSLDILNNFRLCHNYPINTFQATLRFKLNKICKEYLVSQRLKRMPSMLFKLRRYPQMRLSQMQDIGGLRAILPTMDEVNQIIQIYENTQFQHEVKNVKNYILEPKDSGYRCYHIVYKYKNKINANYDGFMVELQIRTKLQHAWATAVETMGTFIDHSLKSSQGPTEWLDFFSLVGNAFAYIEGTPTLDRFAQLNREIVFETVKKEATRLQVIAQLEGFRQVIANVEFDKKKGSLHLIILDILNKEVRVKSYSKNSIETATSDYLKEESNINDSNKIQVVLVSSDSLDSLRKAYPSYFLDTEEFIKTLREIMQNAKTTKEKTL